ncbi:MAG: hypothetical protein ACLP4R_29670 [Solirubrobacteraceae bacterium]
MARAVRSDEPTHHPSRQLDLDPVDRDTIAEALGQPIGDDRRAPARTPGDRTAARRARSELQ